MVLHHVLNQERKVESAETIKKRYAEGYEQIEKRIAQRNGGKTRFEKQGMTAETIYQDTLDSYSIGTLASKPFRNLPYYLIFSLLTTIAVLKFNQNDHDS